MASFIRWSRAARKQNHFPDILKERKLRKKSLLSKFRASYTATETRMRRRRRTGRSSEPKCARSEFTRCASVSVCSTRSPSNPLSGLLQMCQKPLTMSPKRIYRCSNYVTIAMKWLNIRTEPLESLGTCVKATAPRCPSPSSHGNKQQTK